MKRKTVDIITLGCSKNLVDSENLMSLLEANGFECTHDSDNLKGEIVVINTCGFIQDAKQESIDTILQFAEAKTDGCIEKLYVMGCLSQRYRDELKDELPEVDRFYGKFDFKNLVADLRKDAIMSCPVKRHITTPRHYAYIKISEGCNRNCSYCAIPIITGKHKSRPVDEIIKEVEALVADGVKEFQIIAQELTYYGVDIDGKQHIAELVGRIADVPGVEWVRLHYAYPTHFPWELADVIREKPNVCKYLDIALQHISDNVLKRMHRNFTKHETYDFLRKLREKVPGIHIRTTLMVGFPGETAHDFDELMEFVRWARFERMGAFAYSEEDGTFSAENFPDDVPFDLKQERLDKLMALQQNISAEIEAEKVGKTLKVVIDRKEGEYYIGRTEFCSPEVDPEVLIKDQGQDVLLGEFYDVEIIDSEEFDLYGVIVNA